MNYEQIAQNLFSLLCRTDDCQTDEALANHTFEVRVLVRQLIGEDPGYHCLADRDEFERMVRRLGWQCWSADETVYFLPAEDEGASCLEETLVE